VDALDPLLQRTRTYALGHRRVDDPRPAAEVAIVACMDARLHVESLFGLRPGEAHVLRNAGGTVTDDVIRGLIISQRLMGTRHILLVHHTECGMSAIDEPGLRASLRADTGREPAFPLLGFADVEEDVRESMARLRACPFLPVRDQVRGFVRRASPPGPRRLIRT